MKSFLLSYSLSADSRKAVVNYWPKFVHKYWLTFKKTKPAQEKCDRIDMTLTVLTGP